MVFKVYSFAPPTSLIFPGYFPLELGKHFGLVNQSGNLTAYCSNPILGEDLLYIWYIKIRRPIFCNSTWMVFHSVIALNNILSMERSSQFSLSQTEFISKGSATIRFERKKWFRIHKSTHIASVAFLGYPLKEVASFLHLHNSGHLYNSASSFPYML